MNKKVNIQPDHIYYNMVINNTSDNFIPAVYNDSRSSPIVENNDEYH